MQCNTAGDPVCTFLLLCYFHKKFGSSFWGEQKSTRSSNKTAASAKTQNSPSLRHKVLWIWSAHSPPGNTSAARVPWHPTCLLRLFYKTVEDCTFSTESLIYLSLVFPPAAPLAHGICSTHLGLQADTAPCDRSTGRCSVTHQSSPTRNRTTLGSTRSLPIGRLTEPRNTSLTLLHLQDLTGAILSVETCRSLVVLGAHHSKLISNSSHYLAIHFKHDLNEFLHIKWHK